jgi:hypothetical protein
MDSNSVEYVRAKIALCPPHIIALWLNAAQAAYESHGGVGPCPCWMCEWRRSYLYSIGRGDMVLVGSRYVPGVGRTFR